MFINYSHHPSAQWGETQLEAARVYGEVVDIPFAKVKPEASSDEVIALAEAETKKILEKLPEAVLCQGEMVLTYHLVRLLKQNRVRVLCATTNRHIDETIVDGKTVKQSVFEFVQFREY